MNLDKLNKMKYDLIDDLSNSQIEMLVKSMIIDKYCMNKDELVTNEIELIKVFQYLIDSEKILYVLNGVYSAYNELLYDLHFKGFEIADGLDDVNDGFIGLAESIEKSRQLYQNDKEMIEKLKKENQKLKETIERRAKKSQDIIMNPKYVEVFRKVSDEYLNGIEFE